MLNNRFYILLIFAFMVFSCSKEDDQLIIPEGVLTKEEYIKVLTDLSLAESAANLNILNVKIEKMDSAYAFDPLQENNVSRGKYDSTALFYSQHPQQYKEIYDEVLKRLSEMESNRKGTVKDSARKPSSK